MVAPILDYGAPVWSRSCSSREAEKVQNQAYRYFLGVGSKHPLAAASGDMCWMPTSCRHKLAIVAFWRHLIQSDNNKICKKVYIEALGGVWSCPLCSRSQVGSSKAPIFCWTEKHWHSFNRFWLQYRRKCGWYVQAVGKQRQGWCQWWWKWWQFHTI